MDRLSEKDISIFYLHSKELESYAKFNELFTKAFEIEDKINLPCVILFSENNGDVENLRFISLSEDNPYFAFDELFQLIDKYKTALADDSKIDLGDFRNISWVKSALYSTKFASEQFLKLLIKDIYDKL